MGKYWLKKNNNKNKQTIVGFGYMRFTDKTAF